MRNLVISFLLASTLQAQDWVKVSTEDNISIFAMESDSSLIPFKAEALLDANIEEVLRVLKDYKKKTLWSPKLKSVKIHRKLSETEFIFSEYYGTPWPSTDREFLLRGKIKRLNKKKILILAYSISEKSFEDEDHIQADVERLNILLEGVSKSKTNITFEFHGDMKGLIPHWLVNIIQKKWPYRFIQGLKTQLEPVK